MFPLFESQGAGLARRILDMVPSGTLRGLMPKLDPGSATRGPLVVTTSLPDATVYAAPATTTVAGALVPADYASLHPPTARVYNSAAIATVSGVAKTLTFDGEDYDLSAMHSTSVNTSRLTVVRAGRHQFGCAVEFQASNVTERACFLYKNGGKVAGTVSQAGSTGAAALQAAWEGDCVIGDYFEVVVYQVSGVGLNINFVAGYSPAFWGRWCAKE